MSRPLGNDTIVRVRAPLVRNPRDNTLYRDWANATLTTITNCSIQATKLSDKLRYESEHEREHHLTYFRGYAPAGTDLEYTDRVLFEGKTFDMQGPVTPWRRMSGKEHHVTFMMKLQEG